LDPQQSPHETEQKQRRDGEHEHGTKSCSKRSRPERQQAQRLRDDGRSTTGSAHGQQTQVPKRWQIIAPLRSSGRSRKRQPRG